MNIRSAIENTIPISQFNRGLAGKIFEEVKRHGGIYTRKSMPYHRYLITAPSHILPL